MTATGPQDNCTKQATPTITITIPVSGTVSGSSISGTYVGSSGGAHPFSATINGSTMDVSLETGDSSGPLIGTLTQTSTQGPSTQYSGTYSGTYNRTYYAQSRSHDPSHPGCTNMTGSVTSSGPFTVTLSQVGSVVVTSATLVGTREFQDDGHGNCSGPVTLDIHGGFTGTISGNTFTAPVLNDHGEVRGTMTATINNNTLTASLSTDRDEATFTATRTGGSAPSFPPVVVTSFSAQPSSIDPGQPATLSWSTVNAGSVSIDNGIGTKDASGSVTVSPAQTTTYTLTASGPGAASTATATVTVGTPAAKIVATLPAGMLQATGASGATDSFTASNVGTAAVDVTLTPSGNFFTISPASFTLAPGASQVIGITANTQAAGSYDGAISISPGGINVPVRLLVAAPPTGSVNPQPTTPRTDVSLPAGQNPAGSVQFKNNGTATATGIAVADVPWIIPQSGVITIAPGQTQSIGFNIDRSKRPDSASPLGAMKGELFFRFLVASNSKQAVPLGSTPAGNVSVTIVDVVKPGVSPGSPAPLQPGEVALFVLGLRGTARFNDDLSISSRSTAPSISDLQLFFIPPGASTQVSAIPAFNPAAGIAFPAARRNIFAFSGAAGGRYQIRSSQAPNIAMSAVLTLNDSNPAISSATALPVLRSDRSIAAGDRMTFAGAQDAQTTLFIQEVTGNAGHVSIEYRDAAGAVVGTDSGDVGAFAGASSPAVDGTRSIVLVNDSTGPARFAAYAAINDATSGDGWVLTDPLHQWGSASGPLIMPIPQEAQADIFITNRSNSGSSVNVEMGSSRRHHAARPTGGPGSVQIAVAPLSTARTTVAASSGFVRISGAANVSATGRVTLSAGGATFGSSLPAVPASVALANGQGKRFTAVDDASARTVAAATPATYRSTLILIETEGQSATVRVTLRYNFIAGATVSSQGLSTRDFSIGPNQVMNIADLARSVIGAQRDGFGDLRNMQVDVDVIDGGGKVLPFIEAIDNASGDIMMRAE